MKVLVVDDDIDVRESTVMLLELLGHEALAVGRAEEVLAHVTSFEPRAVLHDANMPGLDLPEQMKNLKATGVWITLFTARADAAQLREELGVDALLRKPFEFEDLEAVLERAAK